MLSTYTTDHGHTYTATVEDTTIYPHEARFLSALRGAGLIRIDAATGLQVARHYYASHPTTDVPAVAEHLVRLVAAHIRHTRTNYDQLLRDGWLRERARAAVQPIVGPALQAMM